MVLVLFLVIVPTVIALLLLLGSGVRPTFLLLLGSRALLLFLMGSGTRLPFLLPLRSRAGLLLLLTCRLRLVAPGLVNLATRPLLVDWLRGS